MKQETKNYQSIISVHNSLSNFVTFCTIFVWLKFGWLFAQCINVHCTQGRWLTLYSVKTEPRSWSISSPFGIYLQHACFYEYMGHAVQWVNRSTVVCKDWRVKTYSTCWLACEWRARCLRTAMRTWTLSTPLLSLGRNCHESLVKLLHTLNKIAYDW